MTWRDDARAAWERLTGRSPAPLDVLSDVATLRRQLDLAELEAVREARRARRSWTEIATRLGMTRQSAWEKWRDLDEEPGEPAAAGGSASAEAGLAGLARGIVDDTVEALAADAEGRVGVPDVVGLTWADARERLGAHRLVPKAADSRLRRRLRPDSTEYVVTEQEPAAGGRVQPLSTVLLWLGTGPGDAGDRARVDPPPPPRTRRGAIDRSTGESVW